jgi:hypothetical protein
MTGSTLHQGARSSRDSERESKPKKVKNKFAAAAIRQLKGGHDGGWSEMGQVKGKRCGLPEIL